MNEPAGDCPRFSTCSVNNCPLDESYPNLLVYPNDKERVCPMEKGVRVRIAACYPGVLRFNGLTEREFKARKRYDSLSPEQKAALAEQAKKGLLLLRSKKTTDNSQGVTLPEKTPQRPIVVGLEVESARFTENHRNQGKQ